MTPEQFVYWIQGYCELTPEPPTKEQWQSIREHAASVFTKITPPVVTFRPVRMPNIGESEQPRLCCKKDVGIVC